MPTPAVVKWFRVYCGALCLLYLLCIVIGLVILFFPGEVGRSQEAPRWLMAAYGSGLVCLGLLFAAIFAAGIVLPPRRWVWIYGIVLIAIGFTSPCCIPASVPLLVFWLKPEARVYFGFPPE